MTVARSNNKPSMLCRTVTISLKHVKALSGGLANLSSSVNSKNYQGHEGAGLDYSSRFNRASGIV